MKKNIFLFISFLLLFSCGSKIDYNQLQQRGDLYYKMNSKKPFTGVAVEGKSKIGFKNGKLHGEYKLYYNNEQLFTFANYNNGFEEGKYLLYYENGQIQSSVKFKKGKMDGKYLYFYENGEKCLESSFKDGLEEGDQLLYSDKGDLELKLNYKNGTPTGEVDYYNENILRYKRYFEKNGVIVKSYDKNNQPISLANYKDNRSWINYFEQFTNDNKNKSEPDIFIMSIGNTLDYYSYDVEKFDGFGIKHGEFIKYYENGKINYKKNYTEDKLTSTCEIYSKDGNIKIRCNYKDDKLDGDYSLYYDNGSQIFLKTFLKDNVLNGEWLQYYENGQLQTKAFFENGKLKGEGFLYHENGNKYKIVNFIDDLPSGKCVSYYDNGKIEIECEILLTEGNIKVQNAQGYDIDGNQEDDNGDVNLLNYFTDLNFFDFNKIQTIINMENLNGYF